MSSTPRVRQSSGSTRLLNFMRTTGLSQKRLTEAERLVE
jgi:hypothetical protein